MGMETYNQDFRVPFDYPVVFTRDLFAEKNPALADALQRCPGGRAHRVAVFVDDGVLAKHPGLIPRMQAYFSSRGGTLDLVCPPVPAPGGEALKNDYRRLMQVVDMMLEYQLCRHSFVLIVGGGAILDAVGFGASIIHRGLRVVRVPTTVLAQCDAGIGVKNGMNLHGGKNTIGTFHPPFAVLNDSDFLQTLPDVHWAGGVAEAFKVAMIKDAEFFHDLCEWAPAVKTRNVGIMEKIVRQTAVLHLDHIRDAGDPFEQGSARPLDFGHWLAHKLESMTAYKLSHGEAVSIGISVDSIYAANKGWLPEATAIRLLGALEACGLPVWHPALERCVEQNRLEVLRGLDDFREHLGGELCVTYPGPLGTKREVHEVEREGVAAACRRLKEQKACL